MFRSRPLAVLAALVLAGCQSSSKPEAKPAAFGIYVGQSVESLSPVPDPDFENFYWVTPPEPNPIFTSYRAWSMPRNGLCRVIAYSTPFTDEASAAQLLETYNGLVTLLTAKYGKPVTVEDFADARDLMNDMDNDALWRSWPGENFNEELRTFGISIGDMILKTRRIELQFDFANSDDCKWERDSAAKAAAEAEARKKVDMTGL